MRGSCLYYLYYLYYLRRDLKFAICGRVQRYMPIPQPSALSETFSLPDL